MTSSHCATRCKTNPDGCLLLLIVEISGSLSLMDPKTVKTVKLTIYVTLALLSSVAFIVNGWMLQTALYHCTLFHVVSGILILTSLFGISFFGYLISVRNMPPRVEEPTPKRVLSASELWARRGRAAGLGAVYCCAGVCLMIAIVISIVLVIARSASLPDTSSTLIYSGLHHAVKVEYEDNGVPHIIADDMHDLYFAQGSFCCMLCDIIM